MFGCYYPKTHCGLKLNKSGFLLHTNQFTHISYYQISYIRGDSNICLLGFWTSAAAETLPWSHNLVPVVLGTKLYNIIFCMSFFCLFDTPWGHWRTFRNMYKGDMAPLLPTPKPLRVVNYFTEPTVWAHQPWKPGRTTKCSVHCIALEKWTSILAWKTFSGNSFQGCILMTSFSRRYKMFLWIIFPIFYLTNLDYIFRCVTFFVFSMVSDDVIVYKEQKVRHVTKSSGVTVVL